MLIWDWQYTVFTPQIPETENSLHLKLGKLANVTHVGAAEAADTRSVVLWAAKDA